MKPKRFGYDQLRPVLKRLREYKDAYLLFIRNYKAPFTIFGKLFTDKGYLSQKLFEKLFENNITLVTKIKKT